MTSSAVHVTSPGGPATLRGVQDELGSISAPYRLGDVHNPSARCIRIVHISDTHCQHMDYFSQGLIPPGDILVHSGDFNFYSVTKHFFRDRDYSHDIKQVDRFFRFLPHQHKIFVAGNHELNFTYQDPMRTRSLLRHGIYLQDSSVTLEGIKFHGSPWNILRSSSYARGFAVKSSQLEERWNLIPEDTDVLVTHSPPAGFMDHGGTFGCHLLTKHVINRVRPRVHLFGHAHSSRRRLMESDGIVFSNAAMKDQIEPRANVFDYYISADLCRTQLPDTHYSPETHGCVAM